MLRWAVKPRNSVVHFKRRYWHELESPGNFQRHKGHFGASTRWKFQSWQLCNAWKWTQTFNTVQRKACKSQHTQFDSHFQSKARQVQLRPWAGAHRVDTFRAWEDPAGWKQNVFWPSPIFTCIILQRCLRHVRGVSHHTLANARCSFAVKHLEHTQFALLWLSEHLYVK